MLSENVLQLVAPALALLAALGPVANIGGILSAYRSGRAGNPRGYSCVPLLSLVFACASFFVGRWWGPSWLGAWPWLIAALDPGTWSLLGLVAVLFERKH